MKTVGERLKWARDRRAWTQDQLSKSAGVPIVTISRIENGHGIRPRQSTIWKLATALEIDPGWLLTGEGIEVLGKLAA